jgi:hypothetical protein
MYKTLSIGLVVACLSPLSAAAEDCGRWVSCGDGAISGAYDPKTYIYGETRDVEPWAADEAPADQKNSPEASAPALGASAAGQRVQQVEKIAFENETAAQSPSVVSEETVAPFVNEDLDPATQGNSEDGLIALSPEEEAAMRSYLAEVDASRAAEGTELLNGVTIANPDDF